MEIDMPESSIQQRFLGNFIRRQDGSLVHITGPQHGVVRSSWSQIRGRLSLVQNTTSGLNPQSIHAVAAVEISVTPPAMNNNAPVSQQHVVVLEQQRENGPHVVGIVLKARPAGSHANNFDVFFASVIIKGIHISFEDGGIIIREPKSVLNVTDAIVDHFDTFLRYVVKEDKWEVGGRDYFHQRVRFFASNRQKIEFCLPAFPCKSSNGNKVQGTRPDRGEYIALSNLHRFIEGIERIYEPGAKLWIISDGHVFSDCIGVDDCVVDGYAAQLIAMNEEISKGSQGADRVGFKSLVDLFALGNPETRNRNLASELNIPEISHHISTKLMGEAELCRRILMLGFQSDSKELRRRIDAQDPTTLALYRGFSRFMLDDLELNPFTKGISKSQRRKLSSKVAFEMIQRNQAYSNLVEVMFPHHIRLSIHAHSNIGPKFGVQIFGAGVRTTDILSPDGDTMASHDLLHVPTPWHNCVVEIEGHPALYITKSSIARSALASGHFSGGWTGHVGENAAYFHLTHKARQQGPL